MQDENSTGDNYDKSFANCSTNDGSGTESGSGDGAATGGETGSRSGTGSCPQDSMSTSNLDDPNNTSFTGILAG